MLLQRPMSVGGNAIAGLGPAAWYPYGVGITEAGAGVSQWDDQSGGAKHLKQATDGNRPAKQADGSILFDGVDNWLRTDAFASLGAAVSIYALLKQVTWTINEYLWDGQGSAALGFRQATASPRLAVQVGGSTFVDATGLPVDTYGMVAAIYNGAGSVLRINATETTGTVNAVAPTQFLLGANNGAVPAGFSNIQVKEVLIFASAHDAATRARIYRYLAGVGGL